MKKRYGVNDMTELERELLALYQELTPEQKSLFSDFVQLLSGGTVIQTDGETDER